MKKLICSLSITLVLAMNIGAQTNRDYTPVNPDNFNAFIEWQMDQYNIPGVQIGILHDGALAWKHNYGWSYIEQQIPVDDSTLFMLASISKSVVATALNQMVEKGLVDLYRDINQYLPFEVINPNYPSSSITPYMLMTHSSSIRDQDFIYTMFNILGDPEVTLQEFCYNYLDVGGQYYYPSNYFNTLPGSDAVYSNVGATLAGYLVEAVYQDGFNNYCNDSIFTALDMNRSRWFLAETDTMEVAMPYLYNYGNPVPIGHVVKPDYPDGFLKSNAVEFANFISMFANYGAYNNKHILDSITVEMMTTIQDTVNVYGDYLPYGFFWIYTPSYDIWGHDGGDYGCTTMMFYHKLQKWGGTIFINTDLWWEQEALTDLLREIMYWHARTFSEFFVSSIETSDTDEDGILEPGDLAELVIGVKNVYMNPVDNVSVTLRCDDLCFQLMDTVASLGNMGSGENASNQDQPFQFQVTGFQNPHPVAMELEIHYNNTTDIIHFQLFAGQADVLLVKDERDVLNSQRFYLDVLDSLGYTTHYWDIDVNGNPDTTFLKNFPAVIWYTGYDEDSTVNETNQNALIAYLNHGGRLFMTGQNISDEIGNTVFMNDYLHANHKSNVTYYIVSGIAGDPLSDGLLFQLNEGDGLNNQYSQSALNPVNSGEVCLRYNGMSAYPAGIRFENSTYKTVFLGFGFEGIRLLVHRYELMKRILEYFDVYAGVDDKELPVSELSDVSIMPNPVRDFLIVSFTLSKPQDLTFTLYDMMGRQVFSEITRQAQPGKQSITLIMTGCQAGVYFYRLSSTVNRQPSTGKMVVVK
jgi:CubicO group peptidase (beta-lactamase class C family)